MKCPLCNNDVKIKEYKDSITQACTKCSWTCFKKKDTVNEFTQEQIKNTI